ncbi:uncharacterized protein HMPREF1541_04350 [Cyphellophora europaea CBS 101466]|uniref:Spindle pole body-associated protein cut12 domain-containing protein n=1 Tax=Cyphellophora europaea (strain CBS 101466) TaxID=1220924 RepID=W2RUU4_CYPE1|nr:uncharacterized protein HMPREF1541_04350 [Cyphellophora europaea CBS 101466]ETN40075.1 hypothetical protein HMPREF1541_04350 [Cyphellophora europaea CBS 101466]
MASDETLLANAPITPAHKFAWRAFRGFVYGSPESPGHNDTVHTTLLPQPLSPKRVSIDAPVINLSPQKRKRDAQVSPTKSILRTPGAPTPRAKSLRDVNVKFKSISPENRRGASISIPIPPPAIAELEQQVDTLWEELELSLEAAKSHQSLPAQAQSQPQEDDARAGKSSGKPARSVVAKETKNGDDPLRAVGLDEETEAYARRTEREMKRLLKQHKRLKSYAQRMDERNVELQAMVEELHKENARLTTRLANAEGPAKSAAMDDLTLKRRSAERRSNASVVTTTGISKSQANEQVAAKSVDTNLSRTEAFKRSLRGKDPSFEIHEDKPRDQPICTRSDPSATQSGTAERPDLLPPKKRSSTSELHSQSSTKTATEPSQLRPTRPSQSLRASSSAVPPAQSQSAPSHPPPHDQRQPPRHHSQTSPFSLTALAAQLEPTPAPRPSSSTRLLSSATRQPGRASNINLAPEKVAAARLRLAKRSEERKASQTLYMMERDVGGMGAGKGEEESAVDWANV